MGVIYVHWICCKNVLKYKTSIELSYLLIHRIVVQVVLLRFVSVVFNSSFRLRHSVRIYSQFLNSAVE